ncbi:ABC transporter substrate-binding protein [Bacillus sp. FJAT-28004]|uniref:ABC transporter substrate-binding protein n=1 Tax=Bacillus sp. FJAT-28004 TaxID=1679165 RepID=UPI0006B663CD|nr:ABC transporter substrate-binding protein [Bacillus sp. FJAT-28004]
MKRKMIKGLSLLFVMMFTFTTVLSGCLSGGGVETSSDPVNKVTNTEKTEPVAGKEEQADEAGGGGTGDTAGVPAIITDFKQSPLLDSKSLLPVKERLPEDYKITNELPTSQLKYEIGKYGGTLRTVTSAVDWDADVFVMSNEPLLNTPGILGEEITGNVLKDYEMSEDEKTFTFFMRKGLKWSDGNPVTTEDVRFTVEDILFNKELTPIFPGWLNSGGSASGTPMKFELVDEYTFKISFDQPYGGLLIRLAIQGWRGYTELIRPAHYLKQFHTKYTDLAALEPEIKKLGFQKGEWVNLFNDKDITNWELTNSKAVGYPVLYPWMFVKKTKTNATFERNPYYFKVDPAGNQLPYIDTIQSTLVQDIEMVTLKTIAGEVDFSRESAALVKMPLYKENEKNGYSALLSNMHVTPSDIHLNLSHKDTNWQKVVQDVRFRKALNMAIDRDEVIDTIYFGFAEPSKIEDPTYNIEEANKLLDEMGMKKGPDGFRQGPDGKKFTIPFEVGAQAPDIVPLTELIVEMWKQLGLDVQMKTIDQTLWGKRREANELKATMIWTTTPLWYYGDWGQSIWAPAWDLYHTSGGKKGVKPSDEASEFFNMIDKSSISKPEDARATFEELKKVMGEKYYYFVHIENVKQPLIVNSKLKNIPNDQAFAIAANFSGEQFFYAE